MKNKNCSKVKWLSLLLTIYAQPGHSAVSTSGVHTCVSKSSQDAYCWGANERGQLGLGIAQGKKLPMKVAEGVVQIAASRYHSCALTNEGKVKCWGDNRWGQLGLGIKKDKIGVVAEEVFKNLPTLDLGVGGPVKQIATGTNHSCALFESGKLKCWGKNGNGELGLGVPDSSIGTTAEQMGDNLPAVNLGTDSKVMQVAAGDKYTCALLSNRSVKCWGSYTAIGSGDKIDLGKRKDQMGEALKPIRLGEKQLAMKIATGARSMCAILVDGLLKCWGLNQSGSLGIGAGGGIDGIVGDEFSEMGDTLPFVNLGGLQAKDVSCGYQHCCAAMENKALKCWGGNLQGQLGLEDTKNRGEVLNEMGHDLSFVNLGAFALVKEVSAGSVHTCAVLEDETTRCWGKNSFGQLGLSDGMDHGGVPGTMGAALPAIE